jgi:site-specific recombinase XerD
MNTAWTSRRLHSSQARSLYWEGERVGKKTDQVRWDGQQQRLASNDEEAFASASTRNRHLTMLKSLFNKAIEWGMLYDNPAGVINNMRENAARTRFLTSEEINQLLSATGDRFRPILGLSQSDHHNSTIEKR